MAGSAGRFALLVSKFRGCLVGSLVGDCFSVVLPDVERQVVAAAAVGGGTVTSVKVSPGSSDGVSKEGISLPFTTPTRMVRCVGESLLHCRGFDKDDFAQRLLEETTVNDTFPDARYSGEGVVQSSRDRFQSDLMALRTAPFAMFYYGDCGKAIEVAKESASVFNPHPLDGGLSAVLQCLTTSLSLQYDPIRPLNVDLFLDQMMSVMAEVEATSERLNRQGTVVVNHDKPSLRKLETIREMLRLQYDTQKALSKLVDRSPETGVSSVPAAIFMFLKAEKQRSSHSENPMEHILSESQSVADSGDPIVSLSCSLTGAFHGIEAVPMAIRKRCQGLVETTKLADRLALPFENRPAILEGIKDEQLAKESFVNRV